MKKSLVLVVMFGSVCLLGCGKKEDEKADAAKDRDRASDGAALKEGPLGIYSQAEKTAWSHTFKEHGVSITLPSDRWKKIEVKDYDAAFQDRKHPSLGVSVRLTKEQREAFQKGVDRVQASADKRRAEGGEASERVDGVTKDGSPFTYWIGTEQVKDRGNTLVIFALVWCKEHGVTVQIACEGLLTMRSQTIGRQERDYMESSFKKICLSVR